MRSKAEREYGKAAMPSFSSTAQFAAYAGALLLGSDGCAGSPPKAGSAIPVAIADASAPDAGTSEAATPLASASPTESSGPLAPLPPPDTPPEAPATAAVARPTPPRVLVADELPYYPVRLRSHDSAPEHHHARPSARSGHTNHSTDERADGPSRRPYHPAPGIIVDVVDAEGGLSAADLQRTARNGGYWPFRACYEEGLRKDQRLSGKVSLELHTTPGGAVDRSAVTATTVHDDIVAACVAREARHLALSPVDAETTAKVDVSLAVGDEPVETPKPLPNAAPLRDALRGSWDAVRKCYGGELAGHPDAGGRLEVTFHVRHDGEIIDVAEGDSRFGDVEVTRCVLGVYRTLKISALHFARDSHFVYALHLEAKPDETASP